MKYAVELTLDSIIFIPSLTKIVSATQVILRLLPRQFERL
jgi:hypothetical protein